MNRYIVLVLMLIFTSCNFFNTIKYEVDEDNSVSFFSFCDETWDNYYMDREFAEKQKMFQGNSISFSGKIQYFADSPTPYVAFTYKNIGDDYDDDHRSIMFLVEFDSYSEMIEANLYENDFVNVKCLFKDASDSFSDSGLTYFYHFTNPIIELKN